MGEGINKTLIKRQVDLAVADNSFRIDIGRLIANNSHYSFDDYGYVMEDKEYLTYQNKYYLSKYGVLVNSIANELCQSIDLTKRLASGLFKYLNIEEDY